jgi:hypothetical protein
MANANFVVDNGLQVGTFTVWAANGNVSTTGSLSYSTTANVQTTANSIQPKSYVDVMAVVFGS